MLWGDACSQVAALAAKFVEGTRIERWEAVRDHLDFESGDGKSREPLEFLFAIGASSQPPRNDPECRLLIRYKRQKGDPSSQKIQRSLHRYLGRMGVPSGEFVIRKAKRWYRPFVFPNSHCATALRSFCSAPSPGVKIAPNGNGGAICCFARDQKNDLYAVSAAHPLGSVSTAVGQRIYQPDSADANSYVLGAVTEAWPQPKLQGHNHPVDASAIKLSTPNNALRGHLIGTQPQLSLTVPKGTAQIGRDVCKLGPGNGLTLGRVVGVKGRFALHAQNVGRYVVESGMLITGSQVAFAKDGDSGSPVFDPITGELLAMIVGGTGGQETAGDTVCLPIDVALAALGLSAAT